MTTTPSATLTIAAAADGVSTPLFIAGRAFNRILFPIGFQGTNIAFECAAGPDSADPDTLTWTTLYDAQNNLLSCVAKPNGAVLIVPDLLHGVGWFRVWGQDQSADRVLTLLWPVR